MSGIVWTKFYWSDWESDPSLRLCSLAAQGLWMRMLCVAASHDPIGFVCISGRPLEVTDLARLTGGTETEADALLQELGRNGVFSRDRTGRIYCRRMLRDARTAATARNNGAKGGNPSLSKGGGNPGWDNPRAKGADKPQKPRASTRVEDPIGSSNPGGAAPAVRPPDRRTAAAAEDRTPPPSAGADTSPCRSASGEDRGPAWAAFRAGAAAQHGEDFARAWLDPADWSERNRTLTCRLSFTAERVRRELRRLLKTEGVSVVSAAPPTVPPEPERPAPINRAKANPDLAAALKALVHELD
jgi:hypothetical protein